MNERDLIEKLTGFQEIYFGATTAGERAAASKAFERVRTRLEQERYTQAEEY